VTKEQSLPVAHDVGFFKAAEGPGQQVVAFSMSSSTPASMTSITSLLASMAHTSFGAGSASEVMP